MGRETKVMKKQEKAENKEINATIKNIKRDIKSKKLNKDEKQEYYNEVYHLYGARVYRRVTPERLQKKDIKNLLKNGKFEDIYFKHGESKYNENIGYMKAKYIEQETGNKLPKVFNRISNFIKRKIVSPMLGVALALPASSVTIDLMAERNKNEEYKQYLYQIEEYMYNIHMYAESVNKMNLSHEEVLMKVTKDMWENIKGYGNPQLDLPTCRGLDLAKEDGVGVCRNMADDVARKLNAINKEYNARAVAAYHLEGEYKIADIKIKVVEPDKQNEEKEEKNNYINEVVKYTGNHVVVMLDIKEDNVTLILDPTNPGIGVIKNGQITMFNATKEDNFNEKITPILNYIIDGDSLGLTGQLLGTFREPNLSMEELEEKYGLEAQNRALESVKEKEKTFKDKLIIKIDDKTETIINLNEEELEDIQVLEDVQELEDEMDEH